MIHGVLASFWYFQENSAQSIYVTATSARQISHNLTNFNVWTQFKIVCLNTVQNGLKCCDCAGRRMAILFTQRIFKSTSMINDAAGILACFDPIIHIYLYHGIDSRVTVMTFSHSKNTITRLDKYLCVNLHLQKLLNIFWYSHFPYVSYPTAVCTSISRW
jgi:hypothetical protein